MLGAHVNRGQRRRPIVDVNDVRNPVRIGGALGNLRRGHRQASEANVVIAIVATFLTVRRTFAVI